MTPAIRRRTVLGTAIGALAGVRVRAETFPARPLRWIVPFPAGGPTDAVARLISADWQARLGWRSVVENKSGASGYIGHEEVRRSPADGHVLMPLVTPAVLNYRFLDKPFELPASFTPIGMAYTQYNVVVVNPASADMAGVRSLADLFAKAASAPRGLSFTSAGNGSMGHLAMSLMASLRGVSLVHVPYRGDAPAIGAVLSGDVPFMCASSTTTLPHVRSGRLRALAVTAPTRSPDLPDVGTLIESGFTGVVATPWFGLVAPPGTPAEAVGTLTDALKTAITQPGVRERFQTLSLTPQYLAPAAFAEWVNRDFALWSKVITEHGITAGS